MTKQIFHHYKKWECYQNGMWRVESKEYSEKVLPEIIKFTGCYKSYGQSMFDVIDNWKYCIEHHLTDNSINQRAYIGHAACNYKFKWPEYLVRIAWNQLSHDQQCKANKMADNAIEYFIKKTTQNAQTEIRF